MGIAETTANFVLDKLNINRPEDILYLKQIVFARGALYRECPIQGAEARLMIGQGKPIITVSSSSMMNHERRRFSIAHELGHLELHRGSGLLMNCTKDDIQYGTNNTNIDIEQEANQFASAFLMPARFVQLPFSKGEPSFDLITDWATKLETSLTATAFRFTQFTSEPVAVVFSSRGIIQYFHASTAFTELGVFPDVKKRLGANTNAQKIFSGVITKNKWHEVRALDWFRENKTAFDKKDMIREWSINMPSYEAVLSLLWVHEPLGEDENW